MAVSRELELLYARAIYRVRAGSEDVSFRVGEQSPSLRKLLRQAGAGSACLITAFNPHSTPSPDDVNRLANKRLSDELEGHGLAFMPAEGSDPEGLWQAEESFLVLDLPRESVGELCRRYRQNAVVWIDDNGIADLLIPESNPSGNGMKGPQ